MRGVFLEVHGKCIMKKQCIDKKKIAPRHTSFNFIFQELLEANSHFEDRALTPCVILGWGW